MDDPQVLVVDDDPDIAELVSGLLEARGRRVHRAHSCQEALALAGEHRYAAVVLDVRLPDGSGPELLPHLQERLGDVAVVVLTGYGSTNLALHSIRAGAVDFIEKREIADRLVPAIEAALTAREAREPDPFGSIVGESVVMRAAKRTARHALASDEPALIWGESGTGKELVARALHAGSARAKGPFVAVNCAGIPEALLEAELFGYERGAFTGADRRKPGRFEWARGGTLLLDEIGELHPRLQAKLLRILQDGEYQRLGGTESLHADVRVISATHRDLEREVERGRFRLDLYYRLGVFTVQLPPLRDRLGDIRPLVDHFIAQGSASEGKRITGVEPRVIDLLESYSFPGNVRQLRNVVIHAVVVARDARIRLADLPPAFLSAVALERGADGAPPEEKADDDGDFPTLRQMEREHIQAALTRTGGNKARAARMLGVGRMTLYRKIEEYKLHVES